MGGMETDRIVIFCSDILSDLNPNEIKIHADFFWSFNEPKMLAKLFWGVNRQNDFPLNF